MFWKWETVFLNQSKRKIPHSLFQFFFLLNQFIVNHLKDLCRSQILCHWLVPLLHVSPSHPCAHVHVNEPTLFLQIPPLMQGSSLHSSTSTHNALTFNWWCPFCLLLLLNNFIIDYNLLWICWQLKIVDS